MALSYGFITPGTETDSQAFSETVNALFGDGICRQGGQYALSVGTGFTVGLASGYAIANGRFIRHDEPFSLTLQQSGNYSDRYDAIAARVDYAERKAEIVVLTDIDPQSPIRNDEEYNIFLYIFRIRRGAIGFKDDDVQDIRGSANLCGYIAPLADISGSVFYICNFLEHGMDEEVERLLAASRSLVDKANKECAALDARIGKATNRMIGNLEMSLTPSLPANEWLLCDGTAVPARYPLLREMLGGTLPNIPQKEYYKTYIYGGVPAEM